MKREERILIVEDNPLICRAIEEAGEQRSWKCDCASDGWDAIEKLENGDYAAILIDADVPRHSGYGVLTYLREEVGDELDNVIVMTSYDCEEIRRKFSNRLTVIPKKDAVDEIVRVMDAAAE